MKKLALALLIGAGVFTACDELSELLRFNIPISHEFTIPANNVVTLPPLMINGIPTNSSSTFEDNGTAKDLVKEVRLEEVKLTITGPSQADWDFVDDIEVYINTAGEDEILIASIENAPNDGSAVLELNTVDSDLDAYIKKDEFDLRFVINADGQVSYNTEVRNEMKFSVKADPL